MKKFLSITAIILLAIIASPFALGAILLVLGGVLGVIATAIGLVAFIVTWLIPFGLVLGIAGIFWWLISLLSDS